MGGWNLPDDVSDNHPVFGPPAGTHEPEVDITEINRVRGVFEEFVSEKRDIIDALMDTGQFNRKELEDLFWKIEGCEEELDSHWSKLNDMGYY